MSRSKACLLSPKDIIILQEDTFMTSVLYEAISYLVDASACALQDDDLQKFCGVTLCILTCIYSQHLQQVKGWKPSQDFASKLQKLDLCSYFM